MVESKRETTGRTDDDARDAVLERRRQRRWVPALAGWLTFFVGLHDVIGALLPEWHRRMVRVDEFVPGSVNDAARTATLVAGMLFLLLSHGLRRRKLRAWRAVVALLAFTVFSHIIKDFAISAVVAVAMLAALVYFRAEF